jgi:hypothetical protein
MIWVSAVTALTASALRVLLATVEPGLAEDPYSRSTGGGDLMEYKYDIDVYYLDGDHQPHISSGGTQYWDSSATLVAVRWWGREF